MRHLLVWFVVLLPVCMAAQGLSPAQFKALEQQANTQFQQGQDLANQGQTAQALALLRSGQLAYRQVAQVSNSKLGWVQYAQREVWLARYADANGQTLQAASGLDSVRLLVTPALTAAAPELAELHATLGYLRLKQNRTPEAGVWLRQSLAVDSSLNEPALNARLWLALVCLQRDKADSAAALLRTAIPPLEALEGPRGARVVQAKSNLAVVDLRANRHAQAQAALREVCLVYEQSNGTRNPNYLQAAQNLSTSLLRSGAEAEAMAIAQRILPIQKEVLKAHPDVALNSYQIGRYLTSRNQAAQALPIIEQALQLLPQVDGGNLPPRYNFLLLHAEALQKVGRLPEAATALEQGYQLQQAALGSTSPEVTQTLQALTNLAQQAGQGDKAAQYAAAAQAGGGSSANVGQAAQLEATGNEYENRGEYDLALQYLNQALAQRERSQGLSHPDVAAVLVHIGNVYLAKADYFVARDFYLKASSIYTQAGKDSTIEMGNVLNNLAVSYRNANDLVRAEENYQASLAVKLKHYSPDHPEVASLYTNLGELYTQQKQYDKAIGLYEQALALTVNRLGPDHPTVAAVRINMGFVRTAQGNLAEAEKLYQQALESKRRTHGDKHPEVSLVWGNIAAAYQKGNQLDKALDAAQQALMANVPEFNDPNIGTNPDWRMRRYSDALGVDNLIRKGQLLYDRYRTSKDAAEAKLALESQSAALDLLDQLRRDLRSEDSKLLLATKAALAAESAILTANGTGDAATAFQFAERARAGVLLSALSEAGARRFGGLPDSVVTLENDLRTLVVDLEKRLGDEEFACPDCDRVKIANWQSELFELRRRQDQLTRFCEAEYPDYYLMKYKTTSITAADAQALLDDSTAVVEYFVGTNALYAFVLTNKTLKLERMPLPELDRKVRNLRRGIINKDFNLTSRYAWQLFDEVLSKPMEHLSYKHKRLVVIPDGILGYLPFDVLLTEEPLAQEGANYAALSFLAKEYQVSYAYSATLLQLQRQRVLESSSHTTPISAPLFALAPVFMPRGNASGSITSTDQQSAFLSKWAGDRNSGAQFTTNRGEAIAPLPGTREEVHAIDSIIGAKRSQVLLFDQANEAQLKKADLGKYRYLHFATHGYLNEVAPKFSGLLLAPESGQGADEDNVLYTGEIFNLKLNAELVVLSACETGLGKVVQGEGIIGLTRGFLYAGAQNVMVSLWRVSDNSTSKLMVDFYRNIQNGQNFTSAIQRAKLDLIRDSKYAAPYYWAPFILIGL